MTATAGGHRALNDTFTVAVLLKGAAGVVETVGGLLLLVIHGDTLNNLAVSWTRSELSKDPHDFVARNILRVAHGLHGRPVFAAAYLLSHGAVKIILVAAMLRNKLWAYPATLAFLAAFIVYQAYRFALAASLGLALLTLFDLVVMWVVWREYQLHARARPPSQA